MSSVNIEFALEKLHELQHEGGDLGARYWYDISLLLRDAHKYEARALAAEAMLAQIKEENRRTLRTQIIGDSDDATG